MNNAFSNIKDKRKSTIEGKRQHNYVRCVPSIVVSEVDFMFV